MRGPKDPMRELPSFLRRVLLVAGVMVVAPVTLPDALLLGAAPARAATVSAIEVVGNGRVDVETVRTYVTIRPGRPFGAADIDESIKALYATGLFADVQISQQGSRLVVSVKENPIINRISFEGNRRQSDQTLEGVIESKPRAVLTRSRVQSDVQRILAAYRQSGRFRATVEPKIIELPQNRVDLVFEINEGDKTGVSSITFIGNKAFSDGRLRDVVRTRESGLLSFLRTTDSYDPDRLAADQELLRQFYYNHGYADFRIISAVADLDREQNTFFITFTVEEGEPYTFGDINVESSLAALDPEKLKAVILTRKGDTYSSSVVEKSLEAMTIQAAELGYAFAQVRPRGDRNYEDHTISITYSIDEGPRVYVERINVVGNTRTRDYVIRREFDLVEGDAFNRILLDRAERRLNNLGFFKTVRITTEPGSAPDKVVVNVVVEEQSTGELSFGAGYSTSDGVLGEITLSEKNFLGRGQYVRAMVGGGESRQEFELSFTEPYFLGRRIAAGFDFYARELEETDYRSYDETNIGGGVRAGFPLTEAVTLNLFYNIDSSDVWIPRNQRRRVSVAILDASGENLTSLVGYEFVYNTLDSLIEPRDGLYGFFQQEFAGIGGDSQFIRTKVQGRAYREVWADWGVVGMVKGEAGSIYGLGKDLLTTDQFFIGGETIRGFQTSGIGPRDERTDDALGGRLYVAGTAEATFPLPYVPQELGFAGALFTDAGTLWDVDPSIEKLRRRVNGKVRTVNVVSNDPTIRWSAGFGLAWKSPFGPIRADLAWPIVSDKYDETQVFRISGGTRF